MPYKIDENLKYGSPWAFEENKGQHHEDIKYTLTKGSYMLAFLKEEIIIGIREKKAKEKNEEEQSMNSKQPACMNNPSKGMKKLREFEGSKEPCHINFFKIKLDKCSSVIQMVGEGKLQVRRNYLGVGLPKEGIRDVSMYSKIIYENVYDGVDLVFYFNENKLEYDFILQPGAKVQDIGLMFEGVDELYLDENKDLIIKINESALKILKPAAYQDIKGSRNSVESELMIKEKTASFKIGDYNKEFSLIIDPVLAYSTFLGGESGDHISGVAVDEENNAYVAGSTNSMNFQQTLPPIGPTTLGDTGLFAAKYDDSGQMTYSTIIRGEIYSSPSMTVDNKGRICIVGVVWATTGLQLATLAFGEEYDSGVYACRLTPAGNELEYYVYIGNPTSSVFAKNNTVVADEENNVYFTGWNETTNWADIIPGAYANLGEAVGKAPIYVCKITSDGQLAYFTTVSGNEGIRGVSIAVDSSGSAYAMGQTPSTSFGTITPVHIGTNGGSNTLVVKLSPAGDAVEYLALIGGDGSDNGYDMDIDKERNIYVLGSSYLPSNYPVVPPGNLIGGANAVSTWSMFVSKLNSVGSALIYSVLIGETFGATAIAVDSRNQAHITGDIDSENYPVVNPIYATYQGQTTPASDDIFVSTLNANGNSFVFSTYMGGKGLESSSDLAVDKNGDIYVAGRTYSMDFPVTAAQQPLYGGGDGDGFLFKIQHDADIQDIHDLLDNSENGLAEIKNEVRNIESQNGEILDRLDAILKSIDLCGCCVYSTGPIYDHHEGSKILVKLTNNDTIYRKVTIKNKVYKNGHVCKETERIMIMPPETVRKATNDMLPPCFEIEIGPASSTLKVEVYEVDDNMNPPFRRQLELVRVC